MPPREASTFSPYRIGMRVSRHVPACITELRSMFSARRSCAAPTRAEWPGPLIFLPLSNRREGIEDRDYLAESKGMFGIPKKVTPIFNSQEAWL